MTSRRILAVLVAALAFAFAAGPSAVADEFSPEQKTEIEKIIRDYLVRNPSVLMEALQDVEAKMKSEEEGRARSALAQRKGDVFDDPASPILGNPKGDVTLVEFFDYRCPYCKQVNPAIKQLLAEDKQLRIVMKELPILGKDSLYASRAALAAQLQGKYAPFHDALMVLKGQLGEDTVLKTAQSVGLDVDKLKADMSRPEIEAQLRKNYDLAKSLEVHGTPAFVIGDTLIPGAVDVATLKQKIAQARKG
jgi:protein-disulfide isomerase